MALRLAYHLPRKGPCIVVLVLVFSISKPEFIDGGEAQTWFLNQVQADVVWNKCITAGLIRNLRHICEILNVSDHFNRYQIEFGIAPLHTPTPVRWSALKVLPLRFIQSRR